MAGASCRCAGSPTHDSTGLRAVVERFVGIIGREGGVLSRLACLSAGGRREGGIVAAMEPRIQYAQTADGVSIAFWTLGEGMPLVIMPRLPWALGQWPWKDPEARARVGELAPGGVVIFYGCRGGGRAG